MSTAIAKKYDALRVEFINGAMTLKELADAHGVNYAGLRKAASRGEWMAERNSLSHKVTSEATQAQTEARISELSQFNKDDLAMAKALRGMAAAVINQAQAQKRALPLEEIQRIARIAAEAQKIGRLALGASTDNHELSGPKQGPIQVSNVPIEEYREALKEVLQDY